MSQGRRHKALSKTGRREGERDKKGNFQSKHKPQGSQSATPIQHRRKGKYDPNPTGGCFVRSYPFRQFFSKPRTILQSGAGPVPPPRPKK